MYEGKRGRKFRQWGRRGPCSFCGKTHTKGKSRGNSCRGHKPMMSQPKREQEKEKHRKGEAAIFARPEQKSIRSVRTSGWFSRKHKTAEAHQATVSERENREAEFFAKHREMEKARANRSPEEQLKVLDKRLGKGKGAKKERARLSQ